MVNKFKLNCDTLRLRKSSHKNESNHQTRKSDYLNFGEDDQMEIQGFRYNKLKAQLVWAVYILTFGCLRLIFHWYPVWQLSATYSKCNLPDAEKVLIIDNYKGKCKTYFVRDIHILKASAGSDDKSSRHVLNFHLSDGTSKQLPEVRIIRCKKITYVWDSDGHKFVKLAGLENGIIRSDLHKFTGQTESEQALKRIIYGSNEIIVPVQTILTLLVLEALTPFYMFQLFSLIVWFAEYYYYYTIAIIIMSVFGISTSIIQTRKNQKNLKGTVHSSDKAIVCRGANTFQEIPTTDLVPGDVILISSQGCEMACDAVLLSGSCIVNESMLTGESVPVTKTPIPDNSTPYNVKVDGNHTLFCGTKIIQTRSCGDEKTVAVVVRTGYLTTKGELVRSILYPPPADFKFDVDSYKFIKILCILAVLGFIYTVVSKSSRNIVPLDILIKALDLVTIAIPPALPAAMTVGKLYALSRLKNHKIYCINSRVINVSGSIDCICFDKTGTLTEDELDMWAVVPVEHNKIKSSVKDVGTLNSESLLLRAMASCHCLTLIGDELCGDPLDVKMFESTLWSLQSACNDNSGICCSVASKNFQEQIIIEIVQLYQFSSTLQRMSVITKSSDRQHYDVFCKGSPEMIISLSKPSSIPDDITKVLKTFTGQGYRVIGVGTKVLSSATREEAAKMERDDIECDLDFIGLIVLENKLKPQTADVIRTLKEACFKIVMITGDNIQTAVHVAKESNIIDTSCNVIEVVANKSTKFDFATVNYVESSSPSLMNEDIKNHNGYNTNGDVEKAVGGNYGIVITGNSWTNVVRYFPELVPKILAKGVVFARMSGQQKQQLIVELKNLGYYVAMCGDGANDCGALKAAHVGISLSEAETSVASPFTSKEHNISCVPKVIQEGRAALVTSFGVFKLMLCYSLTEFVSVIILYAIDTNLTAVQYLFIDIFLILNFASFFGRTKAYERLDKTPPMTSLLGFIPLSSIVLFMFLTIIFQIVSYCFIQTYSWFTPFIFNPDNTDIFDSYENYAIYTISMFQYITMAIVFSKGKPYRKAIYTNELYTAALVVMTLVCSYITICPDVWIQDLFELKMPPYYDIRFIILGFALLNFVICVLAEDVFVEYILKTIIAPKFSHMKKSKRKYLKVLQDLNTTNCWPNVGNNDTVILNKISENCRNGFGVVNNGFSGVETIVAAATKC